MTTIYHDCSIQQLPNATHAVQIININGGNNGEAAAARRAPLDPKYSEPPYRQLRILLREPSQFLQAIELIEMCNDPNSLAIIVVDHILAISKTDFNNLLRDQFVHDLIAIANIDKGNSVGNVRTHIRNYKSYKDSQNKPNPRGAT